MTQEERAEERKGRGGGGGGVGKAEIIQNIEGNSLWAERIECWRQRQRQERMRKR